MSRPRMGEYEPTAQADPRRVRLAGWLDGLVALLVAILAWPFPILRAALPWSFHGPLVALGILLADFVLRAVSLAIWRRTPVMYLLDLGLEHEGDRVPVGKSLAWSAAWSASLLPSLLGARALVDPARGLPARVSGLVTRSTL